ncbi:hypothetical protein AVO45_07845 [Ruegeria marisrubri]|uniref:Uncharacterized protein n=1 Tax=Ruegeria marisrubri TaxID=1685379 RepID=A0A0X3TQB6_9RHOB|nr:hypothetical protein [Ruegeria marisrubri]KUJ77879.1 hypothetical protein AVO45_07845 [Ruegeria marisrubri]
MNRTYFHYSTQELEYEYRQHFGNLKKLLELSEELKHRSRPHALELQERVSKRIASLQSRSSEDETILRLLRQMRSHDQTKQALEQTKRQLVALRLRVETLEAELEAERRATTVDFDDIVCLKKPGKDGVLFVSVSETPSTDPTQKVTFRHPDHSISADLLGARVGDFVELDGRVRYQIVQITKVSKGFFVEMSHFD